MGRKVELELEYQNYIENPPMQPEGLYSQACSNDAITIESWRKIWIDNVRANKEKYKSFKDNSLGSLFNSQKYKPCVVAGSGPSLKYNGPKLKDKGGIPLISCLHNFHFMEDNGVEVDYYVTLDAGEVTIEEVYEGGTRSPEEYWEMTKKRTLLAFIGTSPRLLEKWKGKVLFFNCPVPDQSYMDEIDKIESFHLYVSNGGNVLGACLYIAKAFLGANPIAFVGADFSFSYDKKFHAWNSKYDKTLGYVIKSIDVFGNKALTWQSYHNFKSWFDWVALKVPGLYINCTEGGTFGAYPEGNIMAVKQMSLDSFFEMYNLNGMILDQTQQPESAEKRILF